MYKYNSVLYKLAFKTALEAAMNKNELNNYSSHFCCKNSK